MYKQIKASFLNSLFILLALAFVVWACCKAYSGIAVYAEAQHWEQCEAQVFESRMTNDANTPRMEVWYQYCWEGEKYISNHVEPSGAGRISQQDTPASVKARFPEGAQVPVFVNPSNPHESLLYRGFSLGLTMNVVLVSLLAICLPLLFWVLYDLYAMEKSLSPELKKAMAECLGSISSPAKEVG